MSGEIKFDDGAAYERFMGLWSRIAGAAFLDWLAPRPGLRWLDVGCGNGAFTEMLAARCAPAALSGIDPSAAQLGHARSLPALRGADLRTGDAQALPFADASFDAAVMPLVIFFVPDPAKGVAEMARVVRSGGLVTAYSWDMVGGGFPYAALVEELTALGMKVPAAPNPEASKLDHLLALWGGAGLGALETRVLTVQRTFTGFAEYWSVVLGSPSMGGLLRGLSMDDAAGLQERLRQRLHADSSERLTLTARAHAIRGQRA